MDGWKDEWMSECMYGWIDWWMVDVCMDAWIETIDPGDLFKCYLFLAFPYAPLILAVDSKKVIP